MKQVHQSIVAETWIIKDAAAVAQVLHYFFIIISSQKYTKPARLVCHCAKTQLL